MAKLVTIYGGSGFIGRYIAWRMAKAGWRVRVAVRRPHEALFVKTYGTVGQVEPLMCNIRDDASVRAVMLGADAVVNCVGTFDSRGRNNFDAVQARGAERVARIAAELGIASMVHLSAIGANPESDSIYQRTKAEGEAAVREHMPGAVILRPSVVFGPEDKFFNRFAGMAVVSPVLPIVGGKTRFQPVYVDDVAHAAQIALAGGAEPGVYELGGPDIRTFRELMVEMLAIIRRRRLIVDLPFWIAGAMATVAEAASAVTGGLVPAPITRDQVRTLRHDNVVSPGARTLESLGIEPVSMEAILPSYLWRFRPSGQYAEIKESARNLRT